MAAKARTRTQKNPAKKRPAPTRAHASTAGLRAALPIRSPDHWPISLRIREYPKATADG